MRWPWQSLFRLERLFDLLLDALVVLRDELFLVGGQDAEGHPNVAVLELHVEPVLALRDTAGNLEIETADACPVVAQFRFVVRQGPGSEVGEEEEAAGPARARREVVDRVPLNLGALLNRLDVAGPLFSDGRERKRLSVRRVEGDGLARDLVVGHLVPQR